MTQRRAGPWSVRSGGAEVGRIYERVGVGGRRSVVYYAAHVRGRHGEFGTFREAHAWAEKEASRNMAKGKTCPCKSKTKNHAGNGLRWSYSTRYGEYTLKSGNATIAVIVALRVRDPGKRGAILRLSSETFGESNARWFNGEYSGVKSAKAAVALALKGDQAGKPHNRASGRRTYKQAQADIMQALAAEGWKVSTRGPRGPLKFPHAISADGDHQIWFKAQAIYHGRHHAGMNEARSMWLGDIRTAPIANVIAEINRQVVAASY